VEVLIGVQRNEKLKSIAAFEKAQEDLKLNNLIIVDLEKTCTDTDNQLQRYESLYEIVKNERNKYVSDFQRLLKM
jgi:hypothetical protein